MSVRMFPIGGDAHARGLALKLALSSYVGGPCRVCGGPIRQRDLRPGGLVSAVWPGDGVRAAHGGCWRRNVPRQSWAFPVPDDYP